ncbi:MAG: hypothetical protein ACLP5V_04800 [Candidatus Bathyarchaeia archaeon]
MKIKRIVDIFYDKFFIVTKDGHEFGVALSEDGTLYNLKPSYVEENQAGERKNTLGMSTDELQTLLTSQPNFTKPIAKPLVRKRKGDAMVAILFLALITPHAFLLLALPTEISQPKPPTIKVPLPGVTIFISNCYYR